MASCQTTRWVSTSPYVKLTVTEDTSAATATTAKLSWKLEYISDYAPKTSSARAYTVKIAGETVKTGTFDINGKTGTITIASGTITDVARSTAAKSIAFSVSFAFNLTWSGSYKGTLTASGSISIAAKTSYTIKYNANGGSGAPSSQTKWYGTNIKLSSETPTRPGYTFSGWGTSSTTLSVSYSAGATYSSNANITLYAIWTPITYAVKFSPNGGSGGPLAQTKTHGVDLKIPTTIPTRTNYTFKGWGASASSTTVSYNPGATYTKDANMTLYAIWSQSYTKPKISSLSVTRCDWDKNKTEEGTYALVEFKWTTSVDVSSITIEYKLSTSTTWSTDTTLSSAGYNPPISGKSGTISRLMAYTTFSIDSIYNIRITIKDSSGNTSVKRNLPAMQFPIDMKANGKGVSVGKPATEDNLFDVDWASRFSKNTYVGPSKEWDDGITGTKLSPSGGIVIQRESGSSPYLDFRLYGTKNTYDGRIIYDKTDKTMSFLGGSGGYVFDNTVSGTSLYSGGGVGLCRNDTTGTAEAHINLYWADGKKHDIITRGASGLTSAFGWEGTSSKKTTTNLRGSEIQCNGETTWASDQNLKHDIRDFDEKYDIFYANLKPRSYKYDLGTSDRTHIGYIAQEVEDALAKAGLTTQDFAGVAIRPIHGRETEEDENGNSVDIGLSEDNYLLDKGIEERHNLAYTEFIALNTYMIQKLLKENTELKERLEKLEALMNM